MKTNIVEMCIFELAFTIAMCFFAALGVYTAIAWVFDHVRIM